MSSQRDANRAPNPSGLRRRRGVAVSCQMTVYTKNLTRQRAWQQLLVKAGCEKARLVSVGL